MSAISSRQKRSQVSGAYVCIRVCVPVERGSGADSGNCKLEHQSVIKETVCGYLGKKCLGMRGGVGWGGGGVWCPETRPIAEDTSFLKGLFPTFGTVGVIW